MTGHPKPTEEYPTFQWRWEAGGGVPQGAEWGSEGRGGGGAGEWNGSGVLTYGESTRRTNPNPNPPNPNLNPKVN